MTGWRSGARLAVTAAACSTSLALAACGGGGGNASASNEDQRGRFRDAALKFAECMRENGVDVPDPKPGQPGIIIGREGGPEPNEADFQAAEEKCRKHLEEARPELSEEQEAEFKDAALKHAQCMREHGIEMPDPQFESGGRVQQRIGPGVDPTDPRFREAERECRSFRPGIGGPPPG